ncbi:MAG TPA: UDP-glucose/GDP-mannose dehydrogenase family protein [Patescibacteria group bacterium]
MKIAIIGTGYVGLVTGACLAESGHMITCIDKDMAKIERLKNGEIPIYEPELDDLVKRNSEKDRLLFSTDLAKTLPDVDVVFLAVGTPPKKDHSADLSAVQAVSKEIGQNLTRHILVVTKSTVPVGTSELVRSTIQKHLKQPIEFDVASNPEFLREGAAVKDFMEPDRIVVGIDSPKSEALLREIYRPFIQKDISFITTTIKSAEVIKYASNAFLATKISFINEIANFCEASGAKIDDVAMGMGLDKRIGARYLHAGLGYGGSCFPKDVKALVASGEKYGVPFKILHAVEAVNQKQRLRIVEKLEKHLGSLASKRIAVWGLSFKAKTDDIRESPALTIIDALLKKGATVCAYDPVVKEVPQKISLSPFMYDCCNDADALVITTEWEDFLYPDFREIKKRLRTPLIIDGRNLFDPDTLDPMGITYDSIGRPLPPHNELLSS